MIPKRILFLAALALFFTLPAAAEEKSEGRSGMPSPEMMQKAMELGKPAEAHERLDAVAGTFTYVGTMWMAPGGEPAVSSGTAVNRWVNGGRHLRQDVRSQFMGRAFEGTGYIGHDNLRGEYESIWMDNMSTGIMKSAGTYDPAARTIRFSGTFSCPMTGEKERWFRTELKIVSANRHTYTSYDKDPDGKEFKSLELVYTRVK